jgi:transcriptional regulator with XRE-family HTH domain
MLSDMYGPFLRQLRTSREMTQAQLAETTGISQPNLSAYENGRREPTLDVLNRIVVACGYQLVADGGPNHQIRLPLPKAGWFPDEDLPPRLPDDPPDEPPTILWGAEPERRARAMSAVLAPVRYGR